MGECDILMNVQEIFLEVAIEDPSMFEGYTHFKDNGGFFKKGRDKDMDMFIEYVKMIKTKNHAPGKGGIHYPHQNC